MIVIIGITGTFGAGKGNIVKYLKERYETGHSPGRKMIAKCKIEHFSGRAMIAKCAYDHYGVIVKDRDDLRVNANRLRKEFGPDILVRTAVDCAEGQKDCQIAIIESIRCVGEVDYLVERFGDLFLLLAVDAKQGERFKRVTSRGDATDKVTFEEFCKQESVELVSTSPWEQNLMGCVARADYVIQNDGSENELYAAVDKFFNKYLGLQ